MTFAGPVIVVLVHGGPLSSSWVKDNVNTVVDAIDGGQSAGDALADVLFGDYNPSGKSQHACIQAHSLKLVAQECCHTPSFRSLLSIAVTS